VELAEYRRMRVDAPVPSERDLLLSERLTESGRLGVRWLASGELELASSSWVGVVRFSELEVRIVPKFAGGSLGVLRMLDYAGGLGMLRFLPDERQIPAAGKDLFDLVCLLLSNESEVLIRNGLIRDYRPEDDTLEVLRGRLRYRDQYLTRFGRLDKLECSFDEYDHDTIENRLVTAALLSARGRVRDPQVRTSVNRLAAVFDEACRPLTFDPSWYESRVRYHRRNGHYRRAHELAKLILRGQAFHDLFDGFGAPVTAFLLDMNEVFEAFVTRLIEEALATTALRVRPQQGLRAVIRDDQSGRSYATIAPDLVISDEMSRRAIPLDVKYKTYEDRKLAAGDIYQVFMYAYALSDESSERRAGILYPASKPNTGPLLSVRGQDGVIGARITGAGIDLVRALDLLHDRKAELLARVRDVISELTGLDTRVVTRRVA
jgi:5-methylcytosine-specific restriction enzyme subunit McrC